MPALLGLQHCAPVSVLRQQHCSGEQVSLPQFARATTIPDDGAGSCNEYRSGPKP
ncbi:MAG: hypothetical protein AB1598_01150 [Thermodesulfobacteriota bacterium]